MTYFVVTGMFQAIPGSEKDFKNRFIQHAHNSLHNEAECLYYDVFVDRESPTKFWSYEIFTSKEAHSFHRSTEHYKSFMEDIRPWVEIQQGSLISWRMEADLCTPLNRIAKT